MSDELDIQALNLIARMIDSHSEDALLVQRLWKERDILVRGVKSIKDWDMTHSEALSVARVRSIVDNTLADVGERQ